MTVWTWNSRKGAAAKLSVCHLAFGVPTFPGSLVR